MRRLLISVSVLAAVLLSAGCEWESSGSDDSWDSSYSWVNFTGLYRNPSGAYLVSQYGGGGGNTPTAEQSIGKGDGVRAAFVGSLQRRPVVGGSVTLSDGYETFTDAAETGVLTGNQGGTGSVNYETGVITATFFLPPGADQSVFVNYQYFASGTATNPASGASGGDIYTFNIVQEGNKLTFVDNNGAVYKGSLVLVTNPGGRNPATAPQPTEDAEGDAIPAEIVPLSSEVMGQFEVRGTSASGSAVTITGTLQLSPSTAERILRATWIEAGGRRTGDIVGEAPPLASAMGML